MSDDYAATTSTTGTVAVGGSATGEIERRRDIDWFSVELEAGTTYVVDLKGSGDDPLARARLVGLYDSDGAGISGVRGVGDGAGGSWLTFTATESGTYYIAAGGKGNRQGTYTVEVREEVQEVADPDPALQPDPVQGQQQQNVPTVDADATAAGATELGVLTDLGRRGSSHEGSVDGESDGTDYYRFTLTEQQAVTLSLRRQDADADLYLEDGDGTVLASSTRGGTRKEGIDATLDAGTYYVRVAAQEAGDNDYTLRATAAAPARQPDPGPQPQRTNVDPDATAAGATDLGDLAGLGRRGLTHDSSVDGTGDVTDYFRFTLGRHQKVKFELKGLDANADLYLEDDEGNVLASSTKDGTGTEQIHTSLLQTAAYPWSGVYYVRVVAKEAGENSYTLSYSTSDWVAPSELRALAEQFNARPQTPFGEKPDPSPMPAPLTIGATVSEPDGKDFAQNRSTAGRILVDEAVTGTIDRSGDQDWFAMNLEKGTTYRIDQMGAGTGDGTLYDPLLNGIFDGKGQQIHWGDDDSGVYGNEVMPESPWSLNARIFFTPTEAGTYYLSASAALGGEGTYTLAVSEVGDDYAADKSTTGTFAVGSPATGVIDHPDDIDWFKITLEAGKHYRIDQSGELVRQKLFGIYDADGELIHTKQWGGSAFISPTEDATYYIAAGSGGGRVEERTGTYTLSAVEVVDDYAADTGTAGAVAVGDSVWGAVQYWGDRDWIKVELEAGETYNIELLGDYSQLGASIGYLHLRGALYDADGNRIEDSELGWGGLDGRAHWPPGCEAAWVNRVEFTPTESGTYYVEVDTGNDRYPRGFNNAVSDDGPAPADAVGTYIVSVAESEFIAADEYSF